LTTLGKRNRGTKKQNCYKDLPQEDAPSRTFEVRKSVNASRWFAKPSFATMPWIVSSMYIHRNSNAILRNLLSLRVTGKETLSPLLPAILSGKSRKTQFEPFHSQYRHHRAR
jgi:hypothetical protein